MDGRSAAAVRVVSVEALLEELAAEAKSDRLGWYARTLHEKYVLERGRRCCVALQCGALGSVGQGVFMNDEGRDGTSLKLTAALYASRPGVVDYVRRNDRLPDDIPMGGAHIGVRLLVERRGWAIELTADEQLVFEAMVREGRLPRERVVLVPETRMAFEGHADAVEYPQEAVDRILWWLRSKHSDAPATSVVQCIGRWLASDLVTKEADFDGLVVPFDQLPDLSDLEDGAELTAEEVQPYLADWLGSAFQDGSSEWPGYRILALRGSDGSICYCLYLTRGDGLTGLEYELCLFSRDPEQGIEHLREHVGVVDIDWENAPDDVVLQVLGRDG